MSTMRTYRFRYLLLLFALLATSLSTFAQDRDSIRVGQYVLDSFTRYGVPETFITLCDTNGVLIDTMTVRDALFRKINVKVGAEAKDSEFEMLRN